MEIQTVKRALSYEFTQREKEELGRELANKNLQLSQQEASKRSVVASYGSQISQTKEDIAMLSNKLAAGYEIRDTVCEVQYHHPNRNIKTLLRTDTGETWTEPMSDVDFNLWTQFNKVESENSETSEEDNLLNEAVHVGYDAPDTESESEEDDENSEESEDED
jgi:hypothetical protein